MECRLVCTVFVIYLLSRSCKCREPHCTKFAYEEQLLEKMVRMEFNVERMSTSMKESQKETENLKKSVSHELELLQKERAEWKTEIDTSKQDNANLIKRLAESSVVYTRWGRTVCSDGSTLIYKGLAAGGAHTNKGGIVDTQCLPNVPQWHKSFPGQQSSYIYGAEYQDENDRLNAIFGKGIHDQDVPCAVCEVKKRTVVMMFPARTECYEGWHFEYFGYLMTEHTSFHRATVKCVDADPEIIQGQSGNSNGDLFYFVEAAGQLPNPPYTREKELTCVVCTK